MTDVHPAFPSTLMRRGETLWLEDVSLEALAEQYGTPLFVYSGTAIVDAFQRTREALSEWRHLVAYAVKANSNLALLKRLGALGAGADIVSLGEMHRALTAGIPPGRIVFSGVGKRVDEIEAAIDHGIRAINVEGVQELDAIESVARRRGALVPIGMRVNPDVDPATHPYIATGLVDSKFGLDLDVASALLPRIKASEHLMLESVGCHIGSQIGNPGAVADACAIVGRFAQEARAAGHAVHGLDVGGGWAVAYGDEPAPPPPPATYGAAVKEGLERAGIAADAYEIVVEPGRSLVANAGVLLTRVLYRRQRAHKCFVVVDAAMTELIRPALYQAYHHISVVGGSSDLEETRCDVVGPVCESADFIAKGRRLPAVGPGALLAVLGAGAYAASMASNYNSRPRPAEVWVEADRSRIVRERETIEDLLRWDRM